jgi:hypothetical protein
MKWDAKAKSIIQFQTKQFLKPYWRGCIVYEEFPVYGTLLKVDILNATLKIAIEVNGPQHSEFHYFHNNNPHEYLKAVKKDVEKGRWLELNNFKLVELNWDEVPLLSKEFFKQKFDVIL